MKLAELKKSEIQRKSNVSNDIRTPGKDEAANYIETEIINEGRWPMDIIEIADEVGYSRQHTTNVVKQYFEKVDAGEQSSESERDDESGSVTITVPKDVEDEQSFWRGVAEARRV